MDRKLGWCRLFFAIFFVTSFALANPVFAREKSAAPDKGARDPFKTLQHPHVEDELLVKFKSEPTSSRRGSFEASHRGTKLESVLRGNRWKTANVSRWVVMKFPAGTSLAGKMKELAADSDIEHVQPNFLYEAKRTPNDPVFPQLWGLQNNGVNTTLTMTTGPAFDVGAGCKGDACSHLPMTCSGSVSTALDMDMPQAWDLQVGATTQVIAVIDSGVDYTHPDLRDRMWVNTGEIPGDGVDNDNDGYVDDVYGYDTYNLDGDPMDDEGHGTHVAGIIAGNAGNNMGTAGTNWNARVLAVKFLGASGTGSTLKAVQAFEYVHAMAQYLATHPALNAELRLTNNSWGQAGALLASNPDDLNLMDALLDSQLLNVFSAANANYDNDRWRNQVAGTNFAGYPATLDYPNVVSVASTDCDGQRSWFSNYGFTSVDVAAPGGVVLSTVPTGTCLLCGTEKIAGSGSYMFLSGTSMAAPHATGALSLIAAQFPNLSNADLKAVLMQSTSRSDVLNGLMVAHNVNVFNALRQKVIATVTTPKRNVVVSGSTSHTVNIRSIDGVARTVNLAFSSPVPAISGSVSASSVQVPTTGSVNVTVNLTAASGIAPRNYSSYLTLTEVATGIQATSYLPLTVLPNVDLVPLSISSTQARADGGDTFPVSVVIQNQGSQAVTQTRIGYLRLSADNSVTANDYFLGQFTIPTLAAGASTTVNTTAKVPPKESYIGGFTGVPEGNYFLGVMLDVEDIELETNEDNNNLAGGNLQIIHDADLVITAMAPTQTSITLGSQLSTTTTIANQGTTMALDHAYGIYLRDQSGNDTLVGNKNPSPISNGNWLSGGFSREYSANMTLPRSVIPGTYTLVAKADPANTVPERDETNNTFVGPTVQIISNIDLIAESVSFSPSSTVAQGQSLAVSFTVRNQGTSSTLTSNDWSDSVWLSRDTVLDKSDVRLGKAWYTSFETLAAGATKLRNVSGSISTSVGPGNQFILIVVDDADAQPEQNESNNIVVSATPITVTGTTDTDPYAFFFTWQSGVPANTVVTSNSATVSGINSPAAISIGAGGSYSIDGGPFTSAAGTISNNSMVVVRLTSSSSSSTTTSVTLSVGSYSTSFGVTTASVTDTTPNTFSFTSQTGVATGTVVTSNAITVSGINAPAPISISSGGSYSINGGVYTSAAGTVSNGQTVTVRQTSSASNNTTTTVTLTIGGVNGTFSVTTATAASDTTPDPFSFVSQTGVAISTVVTSNQITVAGINAPAPISIGSGGSYSINGGAYTSAAGTVTNGQTVAIRQTSSASNNTMTSVTLTIGGVAGSFSVTTVASGSIGIDLVTSAVSTAPTSVNIGTSIPISFTVNNIGTQSTGAASNTFLYLTNGASDYYIRNWTVATLAGGASITYTPSVYIGTNIPPGNYQIKAISDFNNVIVETNETNNTLVADNITVVRDIDLIVTSVTTDRTTVARGSTVTITATGRNQGATVTTDIARGGVYFSPDTTITTSDQYMGMLPNFGTLQPGQSVTKQYTLTIPASMNPGTYRVGVYIDFQNRIPESNETNNGFAGPALTVQ